MTNKERRQLKAQIRAELSEKMRGEYQDKIDSLKSRLSDANAEVRRLYNRNQDLRDENAKLKDEVAKYKDWSERMQNFCNMSEEERKAELERMRVDDNFTQMLDEITTYTRFFFGGGSGLF